MIGKWLEILRFLIRPVPSHPREATYGRRIPISPTAPEEES